jgi:hopanoid biosynthesis associated RND transporter like protein HpnN
MLTAAVARVVDACIRRAWWVLLLAALLAGSALVYTMRHFSIDTDSTKLFSTDLRWRQRELAFDAAFPQRVNPIAIVVDGATPELAEEVAAALAQNLSARSDLFRKVFRPDGGPFFDRNGLLFLSVEELGRTTEHMIAAQPFLGSLAADPSLRGLMQALSLATEGVSRGEAKLDDLARPLAMLAETLQRVTDGNTSPLSWQSLISGRTPSARESRRFILVQPVLDFDALQPGARATAAIRSAESALSLGRSARVRLTGPVPLGDEEFATVAEGAALNATVTVTLVGVLLWLALRSGRMIVAIAATLAAGLVTTAALSLLVIGPFNLLSIAFAVLFVGLGVDFGIQFCVRYRSERRVQGELRAALRSAGAAVAAPLSLAAVSTAAGFYSLAPTSYRGVSELGLIAGTGMIVAFIATLTLLPALLSLLRPPSETSEVGFPAAAPLERFLVSHRREVLITTAVVAAGCLALLPQLRFDFNPLHLRSPKVESVSTLLDLMQDHDTTPNTVDVLAPNLPAATELAKRLATLPEVAQAVTLASYVPGEQARKLALISDASQLLDPTLNPTKVMPPPTDQENVRAMSRTAEALTKAADIDRGAAAANANARRLAHVLRALSQGDSARRAQAEAVLIPGLRATLNQVRAALQAEPVTLKTLPRELVHDWVAADGRARIEVFPSGDSNDNESLRGFVAAVRQIAPDATGAPVSIQESSRTIIQAFLQSGLWAFASITVLLVAVLRRAADVLMTLAPLLLTGLLTLGLCVVIGQPLNFANIIALPLLFGIGVAFTIYFVMAWRAGASGLLQSSLTRAILFSALTTATAFGSLWLSSHPGTASMGKLLALSLACTLVSALFFLPALLGSSRR